MREAGDGGNFYEFDKKKNNVCGGLCKGRRLFVFHCCRH